MLVFRMALRNILRNRRRSLLTGLMMAGGFVLFSATIGLSEGTYGSIIDMFTRSRTGHAQVHAAGYLEKPSLYRAISDPVRAGRALDGLKEVKAWAPRVYAPSLAFAGSKTVGAQVMGLDPARERRAMRLESQLAEGVFVADEPSSGVVISARLASALKIKTGDEFSLIGQGADGSIANDNFRVAGILSATESAFEAPWCLMHIDKAREFMALGGRAHEIALVFTDYREARADAALAAAALADPSLDVQPWQVTEKEFYQAMLLDKKGGDITNLIIMAIVAVGVLNTLLMAVLERTREYGVLKALGTRPVFIFTLIMTEVLLLALLSSAAGALASFGLNYYLAAVGIPIPDPIRYGGVKFTRLLSAVTARTFTQPALTVLLSALAVGIFPAIKAARVIPVKALGSR
ncbi:MAG: ABC transporter permease [Elusimicrobia bacterium CG08_land_8_20_14_0_20_59_10]|nr:MAG: ABC transporter permease [Elusimicrobia bacterium CG08_land_8_20_14_0_20_59_10]